MSFLKTSDMRVGTAQPFPGGIAAGASLRTPCGLRRIEMVRPGDLVVTRDNGLQPVRRIWERSVTAAEMAAERSLAPICLQPRALGPMLPANRISLAPDQRFLVPGYRLEGQQDTAGCLVAARDLAEPVEGAFLDMSAKRVRFFTILFDTHQVFCVDGLPVESFLASASAIARLDEGLRDDVLALFPELATKPNAYAPAPYKVLNSVQYLPDRV